MAIHLSEICVNGYRGLQNLQLQNLNGINILTGDNNSGKTSILEILSTLNGPDSLSSWASCTRPSSRQYMRRMFFEEFYTMFPVDNSDKRISYSVSEGNGLIHHVELTADIYETLVSENDMDMINGFRVHRNTGNAQEQEVKCMELTSYVDGTKKELYEIYDFQYRITQRRNVEKQTNLFNTLLVPPFLHTQRGSLSINALLSNTTVYYECIEALKEFDPNITGIIALDSEYTGLRPDYRVLSKNHVEGLPLSAYGDGMKKAIILMAAVIKAKNGLLLMDEFETAIHTSAMRNLFSWLLKTAMKMNVQVFLTSHSIEAIEKVLNLDTELQKQISLYTLYSFEGKSTVRRMTCPEAIEAYEQLGVELR